MSVSLLRGGSLKAHLTAVIASYNHWNVLAKRDTSTENNEVDVYHKERMNLSLLNDDYDYVPSTITKRSARKASVLSNSNSNSNSPDEYFNLANYFEDLHVGSTTPNDISVVLDANSDNDDDVVAECDEEDDYYDEYSGILHYDKPPTLYCVDVSDARPSVRSIVTQEAYVQTAVTTMSTGTALPTTSKQLITPGKRVEIARNIYKTYNQQAFSNRLPHDLAILWSKRLTKTAGITRTNQVANGQKNATIELSIKVITDVQRLESTLLHEMCHVAAWILDSERKPPHGTVFWKWAKQCECTIVGSQVTTCHSYDIHKPYRFQCTNIECNAIYSRHSKKGINIVKHRCGYCRSHLQYMGMYDTNNTPSKPRICNGFSLFVKDNFDKVRKSMSGKETTHPPAASDVMQQLAKVYKSLAKSNIIATGISSSSSSSDGNAIDSNTYTSDSGYHNIQQIHEISQLYT